MSKKSEGQNKHTPAQTLWWRFNRFLERHLPEGLYPRSLIIVIAPMVLLQSFTVYFVLEQHWSEVTKRLSRAVARDMAAIIAVYEFSDKSETTLAKLVKISNQHMKLGLTTERKTDLPALAPKPYFSLVEKKLSKYIGNRVKKPFWMDTISKAEFVDVRVQVDKGLIFRFLIPEERVSASQTIVLLASMLGSSLILIVVAIVFLRKQIRPIVRLADAAKDFGLGREGEAFQPSGATEVKSAAYAFLNMKKRIARHVEQRTAMLAGVSHDLRTILTRFKLELAFLGENKSVDALKEDVDEMQGMLEGYMAFVKGDGGEISQDHEISQVFRNIQTQVIRSGKHIRLIGETGVRARVKPDSFKRMVVNLVANALRFGDQVELGAVVEGGLLVITVDDNGPGIAVDDREDVFRPFVRLDEARNLDSSGTGLGLAIALDIAHSHGGNITLEDCSLGGLRVRVEIPV